MPELEKRIGYKPNNVSFGLFMMSEQARGPAIHVARDVRDFAKALASRSTPSEKGSGDGTHLADRYKVNEKSPPTMIGGNLRVGAEVYNDSAYAQQDEFGDDERRGRTQGGSHGRGRRTLRRAAGLVGGDLKARIW